MKKLLLNSVKAAVAGAVAKQIVKKVAPKAIPGGLISLVAIHVAGKLFKKLNKKS